MCDNGRYAGVFLNWNSPLTNINSESLGIDLNMDKNNEHVNEYLKSFIRVPNPQYAIMLKGKWGCGKTYFIKKFLENIDSTFEEEDDKINIKSVFVSLNGIQNTETLNELIRREISPFFYSKNMKKLKQILKSFLKGSIKVDLDILSDKSEEANFTFDIDLLDIFNNSSTSINSNKILVFDDIERCKIEIDTLFGYINNFVEHQKCKVIIIADEDRIINIEGDKTNKEYKRFKEKLIGKSFEIKSDVTTFINSIIIDYKIETNENEKGLILSLFNSSSTENLRILKQTLLEYNNFILNFQPYRELDTYQILKLNLLCYFLVVSFEYRAGNTEIKDYQSIELIGEERIELENSIEFKYNLRNIEELIHTSAIIPIKYYYSYIDTGGISSEVISNLLKKSVLISDNKPDDWEILWKWRNIDDNLFKQKLVLVWNKFKEQEISDIQVLLHISGILINLIEENLLDKDVREIVQTANSITDKIILNTQSTIDIDGSWFFESSFQKEYQSKKSEAFQDIIKYFIEVNNVNLNRKANDYLKEIFYTLDKYDVFHLTTKLNETNPFASSTYEMTAIFENLDPVEFIDVIGRMNNESINRFNYFLEKRYEVRRYTNRQTVYKKEISFFTNFKAELLKYKESFNKEANLKLYTLNNLIQRVEEVIKDIEEYVKASN